MTTWTIILLIGIFCVVCTVTGQLTTNVRNVTTSPVQHAESREIILSWIPPAGLTGNNLASITYHVSICEINSGRCFNSSMLNMTTYHAKNMMANDLYNFCIFVLDANSTVVGLTKDIFRTAVRDTCDSTHFACVNSAQCVLRGTLCDGLFSCNDKSDEWVQAGCDVPQRVATNLITTAESATVIKLTWDIIRHQPDRITKYIILNKDSGVSLKIAAATVFANPPVFQQSVTFHGLFVNYEYSFQVRAENPSGVGRWSSIIKKTPTAVANNVRNVTLTPVKYKELQEIVFTWLRPSELGLSPVTYIFFRCLANTVLNCESSNQLSEPTYNVTGLTRSTSYDYRIQVYDASQIIVGSGNGSFTTALTGPLTSNVRNVTMTPVLYSESREIVFSWLPPADFTGNSLLSLSYIFSRCEINMDVCVDSPKINETTYHAKGMTRDHLYDYKIQVFFATGLYAIGLIENYFKTPARDTCIPDRHYTCGNKQCVPKDYKCDNRFQCADRSDETLAAGCAIPIRVPTNLNLAALSTTSIKLTWDVIRYPADRLSYYVAQNMMNMSQQISIPAPQLTDIPRVNTLSADFQGLFVNYEYSFRVRAQNPSGFGRWSSTVKGIPTPVADNVRNVALSPVVNKESQEIVFTWLPPKALASATLTYIFHRCLLNTVNCVTSNRITVPTYRAAGMTNGTNYTYRIVVYDATNKIVGSAQQAFKTAAQATTVPPLIDDSSSGLTSGEKAGVAIAVIIILLIVALVIAFIYKKSSRSKSRPIETKKHHNEAYEFETKPNV